MDFSLLAQDDDFDFTKYFPAIVDAFAMVGREVEIKKKDKVAADLSIRSK